LAASARRLGGFLRQLQVALVEPCQDLPELHVIAGLDQPLCHLAADAEGEVGLHARLHRPGEHQMRRQRPQGHCGDPHRLRRLARGHAHQQRQQREQRGAHRLTVVVAGRSSRLMATDSITTFSEQ